MSKQTLPIVLGSVILLVVMSQSAPASDLTNRLRLGGSLGMAMSEQEDLNETIDHYENVYSGWHSDWDDSELRSAFEVGAYAEYLLNENWIVGAEFLRSSSSGGYDWYDGWSSGPVGTTDVDADYDATGNLVSAYGVYRLPLGDSAAALRLGAGVGYLFGAQFEMDFDAYQEGQPFSGNPDSTVVYQMDLKATGSALALHGLVGAEYEVTGSLLLSANLAYRVAHVDELEVDDFTRIVNGCPDDLWHIEEGKPLRWDSGISSLSTVEGDKVGLDFSGFHLTLSVAYTF